MMMNVVRFNDMTSAAEKLDMTGAALQEALLKEDWVAIGILDQQCRLDIDEAMADPEQGEELKASLERLLGIYRTLVTTCQKERSRLGEELTQMQKAKRSAAVYKLFG